MLLCANKKTIFPTNTVSDTKVQLYVNKPSVHFVHGFSKHISEEPIPHSSVCRTTQLCRTLHNCVEHYTSLSARRKQTRRNFDIYDLITINKGKSRELE